MDNLSFYVTFKIKMENLHKNKKAKLHTLKCKIITELKTILTWNNRNVYLGNEEQKRNTREIRERVYFMSWLSQIHIAKTKLKWISRKIDIRYLNRHPFHSQLLTVSSLLHPHFLSPFVCFISNFSLPKE